MHLGARLAVPLVTALVAAAPACTRTANAPDSRSARDLQATGWRRPTLVAADPTLQVFVATATNGSGRHLLFVSPPDVDPPVVVDAKGIEGGGGKFSATFGGPFTSSGLVEVTISFDDTERSGRRVHEESIWVVRPGTLEIACAMRGNAEYAPRKCGSGGSDRTGVQPVEGMPEPTFDVTFSGSGTYSSPDKHGGCNQSSPVQSEPRTSRYTIPAVGSCTSAAAPARVDQGTELPDDDEDVQDVDDDER